MDAGTAPADFIDGIIGGIKTDKVVRQLDSLGWAADIFSADDAWPIHRQLVIQLHGLSRHPARQHAVPSCYSLLSGAVTFFLWDQRPESLSFNRRQRILLDAQSCIHSILIPEFVAYAYHSSTVSESLLLASSPAGWGQSRTHGRKSQFQPW